MSVSSCGEISGDDRASGKRRYGQLRMITVPVTPVVSMRLGVGSLAAICGMLKSAGHLMPRVHFTPAGLGISLMSVDHVTAMDIRLPPTWFNRYEISQDQNHDLNLDVVAVLEAVNELFPHPRDDEADAHVIVVNGESPWRWVVVKNARTAELREIMLGNRIQDTSDIFLPSSNLESASDTSIVGVRHTILTDNWIRVINRIKQRQSRSMKIVPKTSRLAFVDEFRVEVACTIIETPNEKDLYERFNVQTSGLENDNPVDNPTDDDNGDEEGAIDPGSVTEIDPRRVDLNCFRCLNGFAQWMTIELNRNDFAQFHWSRHPNSSRTTAGEVVNEDVSRAIADALDGSHSPHNAPFPKPLLALVSSCLFEARSASAAQISIKMACME